MKCDTNLNKKTGPSKRVREIAHGSFLSSRNLGSILCQTLHMFENTISYFSFFVPIWIYDNVAHPYTTAVPWNRGSPSALLSLQCMLAASCLRVKHGQPVIFPLRAGSYLIMVRAKVISEDNLWQKVNRHTFLECEIETPQVVVGLGVCASSQRGALTGNYHLVKHPIRQCNSCKFWLQGELELIFTESESVNCDMAQLKHCSKVEWIPPPS